MNRREHLHRRRATKGAAAAAYDVLAATTRHQIAAAVGEDLVCHHDAQQALKQVRLAPLAQTWPVHATAHVPTDTDHDIATLRVAVIADTFDTRLDPTTD
ncbi:hypothetical protein [Actinoplanes xinjiangensis]|uniref:hypothetical protein n=1 Tax=Actinoplanes xinjiangensis TaxID=512350 RepID=UPI00344169B7